MCYYASTKSFKFQGVKQKFDQDEKLSLSFELSGSIFAWMAKMLWQLFAVKSFQKTWHYLVPKRFHRYFTMVDTWSVQSARILLLWWCLVGDMHKNMEGKFVINFHSRVMHVIWWYQSLIFGFLFCLTIGTLTLQRQRKKKMMFSIVHG